MSEQTYRCPCIRDGFICPDDLCRNAAEQTLCGVWIEDWFDADDDEAEFGEDR